MADFETGLGKNAANFTPLTPIDYLLRAAEVYADYPAIVHGSLRQSWGETFERCRRLASALRAKGFGKNTTIAALMPNTPAMVEAHFGVPMSGGVLCTLNTRLDTEGLVFCLEHGEAQALLVDTEFAPKIADIRAALPHLYVIQVNDILGPVVGRFGDIDYEKFLESAPNLEDWVMPDDEWDTITLNYTSGTTGNPKGVVYHHRGAAINAVSNILEWDMPKHAVYLWTLPLFHCNGWCFPWTVAARAGVNVCLRKVEAQVCFDLIREHGVTHYSAAPIVHNMLAHAPDELKQGIKHEVKGLVAGAAPPEAMLANMESMGFNITHVYGLTEVYGPASVCVEHPEWGELPLGERAAKKARQGVRYHLQRGLTVLDPITMQEVAHDGKEMGELMFRGNIVMKGYLKNPQATEAAFAGGWFHSGDLGVIYPDGYVQIKDRSKDIIISGGENISSIEVEDVFYKHPDVQACAIVALEDEKWGEVPVAFVELKPGLKGDEAAMQEYCRGHMARFKVPKHIVFGELPKTATNKIQKYELRKRAREFIQQKKANPA